MNFKSITALGLVLSLLVGVQLADAASKKTSTISKKQLERLLKKSKSNKNAPTMVVKDGSKGGVQVVTEAQGKDKINSPAKAPKSDNKVSEPKVIKLADKKDAQAQKNTKAKTNSMLMEKDGKSYFLGTELPADYKTISIYGEAEVSKKQAVAYIKQTNPKVRLACSVEELVDFYWQEAEREEVRPDLALAQSLVETGTYAYGGDVHHNQNNFCGLGTTGGGVKGATFKTPELGVRAHIQHLLAYTQKKRPQTKIVDPRYELAHNIRMERGMVDTWYGLNGTWAMGSMYCEKIMATYQKMLAMPGGKDKKHDAAKNKQNKKDKKDKKKQKSMRERVQEVLKEK
ncbi:MAG: glucosaminidase domain-containing protein [Phascolarctobacterium sp.]|nr:glucosaminidase domain-containing protein [Phascolarctobacterium sp.]